MANNKAIAIAALKTERAKIVASIQSQLDGIDAAIRALGGTTAEGKPTVVRRGGGKKRKPPLNAMAAVAVKRGTATPEQCKLYAEIQTAKGNQMTYTEAEELNARNKADKAAAKEGHDRAAARTSPGAAAHQAAAVPRGASLAE